MQAHQLENRRNRVKRLQSLALADRNHVKALQAAYLLNAINTRLNSLYCLETRFTN